MEVNSLKPRQKSEKLNIFENVCLDRSWFPLFFIINCAKIGVLMYFSYFFEKVILTAPKNLPRIGKGYLPPNFEILSILILLKVAQTI
jgi:hypothetical protein